MNKTGKDKNMADRFAALPLWQKFIVCGVALWILAAAHAYAAAVLESGKVLAAGLVLFVSGCVCVLGGEILGGKL